MKTSLLVKQRLLRGFSPNSLFAGGENGLWLDASDITTMFTDTAGTTPATVGSAVALLLDKSGNSINATQATLAARPTYQINPARVVYDGVDDNTAVNFGAAFAGDVLQGTLNGTLHYRISVPGAWQNPTNVLYRPDSGTVIATIARGGTALTAAQVSQVRTYLQSKGAKTDYAGVTSMTNWFRSRTDVTAIYSGYWDTGSVTTFAGFAQGCTNLTTLDVSNWDTSSVTTFLQFADGCTSLTTVTVTGGTGNPFADSPCTNYANAFRNTNLTQASIDAILVAINDAGTSTGTFNQSGGSAPSVATGQVAITALRLRGWTVSVTGGF